MDAVANPTVTVALVLQVLHDVVDPELHENIVELGMVRDVVVDGRRVSVEIALTTAACPLRGQLRDDVVRRVSCLAEVDDVVVTMGVMDQDDRAQLMSRARRAAQERSTPIDIPDSTRVLGIVSGKGGVGKSSISVNLAVALAARGLTVGILDADIWGFSVPRMLGAEGTLEVRDGKIQPIDLAVGSGTVRVVSMGFLSGEDDAIMWRGLMLSRALQHFLEDVSWGALDYLVVDMPPGTGDVQMGLARMLPRAELVVVTTPALAAQKVAGRAADMARKGHLRIAGVIENMSGFTCNHGEVYALFGEGGGSRLAGSVGVPLIGSVPIDPRLAAGGDSGHPVALDESSPVATVFAELAARITTEIAPVIDVAGCSARLLERVEAALDRSAS